VANLAKAIEQADVDMQFHKLAVEHAYGHHFARPLKASSSSPPQRCAVGSRAISSISFDPSACASPL